MNEPIGQAALQAQGTVKQQPAACLSRPLQPQAGRGLRLQTRTGFSSCLQQGNSRSLHSPWAGHALILDLGFLICKMNVSDSAALSAGFYLTGSVRVTQRLARRVMKQGDSTHQKHLSISFPMRTMGKQQGQLAPLFIFTLYVWVFCRHVCVCSDCLSVSTGNRRGCPNPWNSSYSSL